MQLLSTARAAAAAAISVVGWALPLASAAQAEEVPVLQEPLHTLRLETSRYRVYEVTVPVGQATLFHRHSADNFAVFLSSSNILNERADGTQASVSVQPGGVTFAAGSAAASYVHRIRTTSGDAFHNVTIELLGTAAPGSAIAFPGAAGFFKLRESARGAAFRVELEPSATVTLPTSDADTLLVCMKPATFILSTGGQPGDRWSCDSGQFKLLESPSTTIISAPTPVPGALVAFILN